MDPKKMATFFFWERTKLGKIWHLHAGNLKMLTYPTPKRSEGVGYKKLTKYNCTYYAEASEKGGGFSWSVRLYVCL